MLTTITTNCLLYPKRAEELKGKVDMLHFSLDSIVEEKHNASRRVNCYQHVMESIDQALNLGEKPDILFTVTPQNIEELPEILNFCKSKNLVLIVNPIFNYQGISEQEDFTIDQLNVLIKFGKEEGVFLNRAFIELRKNGGNDIKNPVCKAGSNTIVISPENKLITPCYHLGTKEFPIKSNLKDLFYSDKVEREKSKAGQLPECEGCTINCYMQPSFSTHLSKYFFYSLPSTLKYNRLKGTWKKFFRLS